MRTDLGYFEEEKLGKAYDLKLLKRLYPFTRPYKTLIVGSIILVVVITFLDLSLPYLTKTAIDRYIVPRIDPGLNDGTENSDVRERYIQVDLTDPGVQEIVKKYY